MRPWRLAWTLALSCALFWSVCGAARADDPSPIAVAGWSAPVASCEEDGFAWTYRHPKGFDGQLKLRPHEAEGFGKSDSFSLAYVSPEKMQPGQEAALSALAEAVLAQLQQQDQGQWKKSLPCKMLNRVLPRQVTGKAFQHLDRHPLLPLAETITLGGAALLVLMCLLLLPLAWKWWRKESLFFRRGVLGLMALAVLLQLGPSIVLDELFHGPWRVEDSRELPILWGYYPAGVQSLMWWMLRVLPPSMSLLYVLNHALMILAVATLTVGVRRLFNERAGLFAGLLAAASPWLALYARGDTEVPCAMAAVGLLLLALSVRRSWGWLLSGLCLWWVFQQRPEYVLLIPLVVLGQQRWRLLSVLPALALHVPYLMIRFGEKAEHTIRESANHPGMLSKLPELVGLGNFANNPGVILLPLSFLWVLRVGGVVMGMKKGPSDTSESALARLAKAEGPIFPLTLCAGLLTLAYVTHRTGNPAYGELRYLMNVLMLLWTCAGVRLASWGKRGQMELMVVALATLLLGWPGRGLPETVDQLEAGLIHKAKPQLGAHCVIVLPTFPDRLGQLHDVADYAARPLWPLTWGKQGCKLMDASKGLPKQKNVWIYLGPYCYRFAPVGNPVCDRWRHGSGKRILQTVPIPPELRSLEDEWDEQEIEIGFIQVRP